MFAYSGQEDVHQDSRNALAARYQRCQQPRHGGRQNHSDRSCAGYECAGQLQPALCQDAQVADCGGQCDSSRCLQYLQDRGGDVIMAHAAWGSDWRNTLITVKFVGLKPGMQVT